MGVFIAGGVSRCLDRFQTGTRLPESVPRTDARWGSWALSFVLIMIDFWRQPIIMLAGRANRQVYTLQKGKRQYSQLKRKAKMLPRRPQKRKVETHEYDRNQHVKELAKRRANGVCQLCGSFAPFKTKDGKPFLEAHHIEWLARNGQDILENTVALCPNCHRKMHILDLAKDRDHLKQQALVDID